MYLKRVARRSSPPSYMVFTVMFVLALFVIVGIPLMLLSCYQVCIRFRRDLKARARRRGRPSSIALFGSGFNVGGGSPRRKQSSVAPPSSPSPLQTTAEAESAIDDAQIRKALSLLTLQTEPSG